MLIFNTTYLVADKVHGAWLKWVREQHIPQLIQSGFFHSPQVAKVLSVEEQEGTSYSVQFRVADMDALEQWHLQYATDFEQDLKKRFSTDVLFFATVLQIIS